MVTTDGSSLSLFGISLEKCPSWFVLAIGSSGIFATFLLHGIAHEKLISHYDFNESLFMTFCQFLCYSLLNILTFIRILIGKRQLRAPFRHYVLTCMALSLSMTLGNVAALRLSYPTEVLFKSSKLIPVMIGNIVFLNKKPKPYQVASVCLIVVGLIGISLGDFRGKNKFDVIGVIAVLVSLSFDSAASNLEDKSLSFFKASQSELISVLYGCGAIGVCVLAILSGQMQSGIRRVLNAPSCLLYIFEFAFLGAVGIQFVYLIMKRFGSLTTVMITSLRKAMTVCLSFVVYKDKQFTSWHFVSILIIAAGMSLNIKGKTSKHSESDEVSDQTHLIELESEHDEKSGSIL